MFVHLYEGLDQPEVLGPGPVTHPVLDRWVNQYLNENLFKLLPNSRGPNSSRTKEHLEVEDAEGHGVGGEGGVPGDEAQPGVLYSLLQRGRSGLGLF